MDRHAADLNWLTFLLVGDRERSIEILAETMDAGDDANPFLARQRVGWSRRVAIAGAMASIRQDLAESARALESSGAEQRAVPGRGWSLDPNTTRLELERALLRIDVFPRAAVLFLTFERMAIAEAAALLDAPHDLVRKAHAIGLRELTANLAEMQGWRLNKSRLFVSPSPVEAA